MGIADFCVRNPVSVTVGILLAVLFGTIALLRLPIQMIPTVDRPEITVETDYRGAAPLEVEREVTDRLEEKLNAVEHLKQVSSTSIEGKVHGRSQVRLGHQQGRGPFGRLRETGPGDGVAAGRGRVPDPGRQHR